MPMINVENIAAGPGTGYTVKVSLLKCWADDARTIRQVSEGIVSTSIPCGALVDEDGLGLCADCLAGIVG
jgi:hypothetical protein